MLALGWQKGRLLGQGDMHPDTRDVQVHGKALWQGQTGMFEKWLFSPILSFETFSLNYCADMPFVRFTL